jgi:outer membrane cobalamin receptor
MLQYRLGALVPYVRIENVTDEQYEEVLGFASPRRRALLGLRYTVK